MGSLKDFIVFESVDLITYSSNIDYKDKVDLRKNDKEILKLITTLGGTIELERQMRDYKVSKTGELLIRLGSPWIPPGPGEWTKPGKEYSGIFRYELRASHFTVNGDLHIVDNKVKKLELTYVASISY